MTYAYAYEGLAILRETRTGGAVLKYVHDRGVDEPLAREDESGAMNYLHVDALGSVLGLTSQGGAILQEHRYDAWGTVEVGVSESGYSFTSREWDPEVALHYYRARYYDPQTGRFISEDPIGFKDGPNRYAYVSNDPVNFIDPSGQTRTEFPKRPPAGSIPCRKFTWTYYGSLENPYWPCYILHVVLRPDCSYETIWEETGRCGATCPVDPVTKEPQPCNACK